MQGLDRKKNQNELLVYILGYYLVLWYGLGNQDLQMNLMIFPAIHETSNVVNKYQNGSTLKLISSRKVHQSSTVVKFPGPNFVALFFVFCFFFFCFVLFFFFFLGGGDLHEKNFGILPCPKHAEEWDRIWNFEVTCSETSRKSFGCR